jgi:hypothetical protein
MKKLNKFWQQLSSLSLSIWLLIISSLVLFFNSNLANGSRYQLYRNINTTPLFDWLMQTWHQDIIAFMAVLLLIISLALLALNTFACTISRLNELSRQKNKNKKMSTIFVSWAPTLMHILFFMILGGHMSTFCLGKWQQYTVKVGETVKFFPGMSPITINSFARNVRSGKGVLQGSTICHQLHVTLENSSRVISELNPLKLPNGDWLILMPPQKKEKKGRLPVTEQVDCSGEERHIKPILFDPNQPIFIKQISDPGVYFLFIGFGLILILMGIYYAITWKTRNYH